MRNPLKSNGAAQMGILLARVPIGLTFLCASIEKLTRIGVKSFVDDNTKHLPDFLPRPIGQTYLYAVPFFELAVGTLLIVGLFTRSAATVASLMLISFMIAVTGAFTGGDILHVNWNTVYLGVTLLLMTTGGGQASLDRAFFGPDEIYR